MVKDFVSYSKVTQSQCYTSNMLENLINDLLDLAKIENNKFTLNLNYFDLTETIEQTLKIMEFQAN